MPEKGWAILTVKVATAAKVKELAHRRGLSVDEYINYLINGGKSRSRKADWAVCSICGVKIKAMNLPDHRAKVHPKTRLTSQ